MVFSVSDITMDQKSADGNKEQSFASLPPEPNGRNKSMGVHDRIPPDPANPGIGALLRSPAEPSGTLHFGQIKKDQHQKGLHLCKRGTLG
jgi:hypothetical protein